MSDSPKLPPGVEVVELGTYPPLVMFSTDAEESRGDWAASLSPLGQRFAYRKAQARSIRQNKTPLDPQLPLNSDYPVIVTQKEI